MSPFPQPLNPLSLFHNYPWKIRSYDCFWVLLSLQSANPLTHNLAVHSADHLKYSDESLINYNLSKSLVLCLLHYVVAESNLFTFCFKIIHMVIASVQALFYELPSSFRFYIRLESDLSTL